MSFPELRLFPARRQLLVSEARTVSSMVQRLSPTSEARTSRLLSASRPTRSLADAQLAGTCYGGCCCEIKRTGEDPDPPEHGGLLHIEEPVTPVEDRSHGRVPVVAAGAGGDRSDA